MKVLFRYPLIFTLVGALLLLGCAPQDTSQPTQPTIDDSVVAQPNDGPPANQTDVKDKEPLSPSGPPPAIRFREVASSAGLTFQHRSGAKGNFTYPEIMSAGVCLADFDNDGDLDVYVPQGGPVPGDEGEPGRNALFLNNGTGQFENVSSASGADNAAYGTGAFAADVDEDGDLDLLLTNVGSLVLLRNRGDATFEDVTAESGLPQRNGFWLNAACGDFNADGHLDIYVANYTDWRPGSDPPCKAPGGGPDYCNPTSYQGEPDLLLFGRGDGTFEDVTEASGVATAETRSMGVIALDADRDGDQDLYVANDGQPNLLWINQGDGTFKDEGLIRGAAVNSAGASEASMGLACADLDGDGDEDFLMTHLDRETHTLYRNDGGYFMDVTAPAGLAGWSRPDTGFGVVFADFNLDGLWDLFVANGSVARPTTPRNRDRPYAQADRVAMGETGGRFSQAIALDRDQPDPDEVDTAKQPLAEVSRGAAYGDLDGDGRIDLVVAAQDAPLRFWQNQSETTADWIAIRPVPRAGAATVIGAEVNLICANGQKRLAVVRPHGSYLGSSEDVVRFGLPTAAACTVEVKWPNGKIERFTGLAPKRIQEVIEGSSQAVTVADSPPQIPTASIGDVESEVAPDVPSGGTTSRDLADTPPAPPVQLGPFPPLRVNVNGRKQEVLIDVDTLADWCRQAGLPQPPELSALDAPTWKLVHPAIERAGRDPGEDSLGELAMFYDGHGAWDSAAVLYERLTKLAPRNARWWHLLGRVYFDLGQIQPATRALQQATQLAPSNSASYWRLGEAQLSLGDAAAAQQSWQKYVTDNPRHPLGYVGLARAAEGLGENELAMQTIQKSLALAPNTRTALVLAARVAAKQGNQQMAEAFSRRSAELDEKQDPALPDETDRAMREFARTTGYLRQAVNYYKSAGKLPAAYAAAKLLAERLPEDVQNWQMLTWLALAQQQMEDAGRFARTTLDMQPDFAPAWEAVARSSLAAKDLDAALQAIDRALEVDASYTHAYVTRGIVLGSMKNWPAALQSLEKGLPDHPSDVEGQIILAMAQANTGNLTAAKTTIEKALRLAPKHPGALAIYRELQK